MDESQEDKAFEKLLEEKPSSETREKTRKGTEEREMLTNFLSQLSERVTLRKRAKGFQ